MKKFIFTILALTAFAIGSLAKDFTPQQKSLRLDIVKYLSSEGFKPSIDSDGDVKFKKDDNVHYVVISSTYSNPFLISLYLEFLYDEDGMYTKKNLESCIPIAAKHKAIKLYCMSKTYTYRVDMFCENVSLFKSSFYSLMKEIDGARRDVAATLNSGLGGMDIMGDQDAVFNKAMSYYRIDDFEKTYPIFRMLTESGYAKAYGYMGLAYELGEGTEKNEELMIKNYEKAIENGYNWCAYRLGNYFYKKSEYAKAMTNYEKCGANENGFRSEALYKAGKMYENGIGTQKDIKQAILCYKKSVQYSTEMECDARKALKELGETVEKKEDFVDATKTMLMGLSPKDMYDKGYEYEQGLNMHYVSLPKAYAYYKAAADKGYTKAYAKMGEIYRSQYYPFNDASKSDKYYQKAYKIYKQKEDTDGDACYELGRMYKNGYGVAADGETAKYYFKSGALKGNIYASYQFGLICKGEYEYPDAFKYFQQSADKGLYRAMFELAELYEKGLGVTFNRDKAVEWYTKCLDSNSDIRTKARKALKSLGADNEKD